MTARALLLAAALIASPAYAEIAETSYRIEAEQTRKAAMRWETAFVAASAADLIITVVCIEAVKDCTEANPLAKSHSPAKMIAIKSALTLGHFLFVKRLSRDNPKAALRFAQVSVGFQGGIVGVNIVTVF